MKDLLESDDVFSQRYGDIFTAKVHRYFYALVEEHKRLISYLEDMFAHSRALLVLDSYSIAK
ncbi:hypothetical protein RND71_031880 [Anisodus tanguticus]|uniref:Uncharacterized protein n=1 Tax=Anisodus tanguticus TaxID=243964 RepID=A0AAE1RCJ0_9SOLA|nr:hypothetical protein RND71_031880 [Anisodus tanguticus]